MVKEKRILSYYIGWFILGLLTYFFINVIYVKADTITENIGYLTSNTNVIISNNAGADINLNPSTSNNVSIDIKTILFNIDYDFKASTNYQLEISTPNAYLSNVNNVTITSGGTVCSFNGLGGDKNFPQISFNCPSDVNYLIITLTNTSDSTITSTSNFRWNYTFLRKVFDNGVDLGPVISGQDQIKDNITNSTNTITGTINDMEQSIVESNKETQDVIKDQFNTCRDSYNIFNPNNVVNGFTNDNTGFIAGNGISTGYIEIISGKNYYILSNKTSGNWGAWYDENKNYISGITLGSNIEGIVKSPTNAKYLSFSVSTYNNNPDYANNVMIAQSDVSLDYEPFGEQICSNKIDNTNDKLNNIEGALTDSSSPNMDILGDSAGWLPPGPLDVVINLPLTMMNNLLSSLERSCSKLRVNLPFVNKNLEIPCISELMEQMGALSLWQWTGRIASVLILYSYLMNLYAWADKVLTLRAEFDEAMGADLANWGRL